MTALRSRNRSPSMSLKVVLGSVALFVGFAYALLEHAIPVFVELYTLSNASIPSANMLSLIGIASRTLTIVLVGLLLVAGYLVGRSGEFRESYASIFLIASSGVAIGWFVGYLALVPGPDGVGWYLTVVVTTVLAFVAAIPFGLVAFAGAALANVRTNPPSGTPRTTAGD